jgi:hypothetical protein
LLPCIMARLFGEFSSFVHLASCGLVSIYP